MRRKEQGSSNLLWHYNLVSCKDLNIVTFTKVKGEIRFKGFEAWVIALIPLVNYVYWVQSTLPWSQIRFFYFCLKGKSLLPERIFHRGFIENSDRGEEKTMTLLEALVTDACFATWVGHQWPTAHSANGGACQHRRNVLLEGVKAPESMIS